MISVPLDKKKHERNRFDCGVEALNNRVVFLNLIKRKIKIP